MIRSGLHVLHVAAIVVGGIAVGKVCQYAAVAAFAPRLGFDLASSVGLAPFFAGLLWLKVRCPGVLAYRAGVIGARR